MSDVDPRLAARAERLGVATSYEDWAGDRRSVAPATVNRLVALLDSDSIPAEPARVDREEPGRCTALPDRRVWGWQVQLYGVRSARSWGIGDLADLRTLVEWTARELGGDFVLVNPLHAAAPGLPQQHSPYSATSRRFTNPMYLALDRVPEAARLRPEHRSELARLQAAARALNDSELIDRDAAYRLKSAAWELLAAAPLAGARRDAYAAFCAEEGRALEDFAVFCALAETYGTPWQEWPDELRHPDDPALRTVTLELQTRVELHRRLQWLCTEQLTEVQAAARAAGMAVGVIHDLAVGADPGGADAWSQQDELALGWTIGAPPDSFNQRGQSWRLPPPRPDRLRATGCAAFRGMVRAQLRHAGGLRIDHALGLWRLWWVPDDADPSEGTYVSYPADELLAVLAEESQAAGAVVVAEDLGTVPEGIPEALRDRGIASSAVLWFERDADGSVRPAGGYPDLVLASVTTHDLPSARGFWRGTATDVRRDLALFPDAAAATAQESIDCDERATMLARLTDDGLVGTDPSEDDLVHGMHVLVARSPARLFGVSLSDATGEVRQPNMPGTVDEYPNWRLPLADGAGRPVSLEELCRDVGVRRLAAAVAEARQTVKQ